MITKKVEDAILKIGAVVREWDEVDLNSWREDHTRYGVIDPVLRALGWNTADPKECHPEYPALLTGAPGGLRSVRDPRRSDHR